MVDFGECSMLAAEVLDEITVVFVPDQGMMVANGSL